MKLNQYLNLDDLDSANNNNNNNNNPDNLNNNNLDNNINNGADDKNAELAMYAYASGIRLMADLQSGDSYYFLLENPVKFQRDYEILSKNDGIYLWSDCPVLSGLDMGEYIDNIFGEEIRGNAQDLFADLYLARRDSGDYNNFNLKNQDDLIKYYDSLWEIMTEAAS